MAGIGALDGARHVGLDSPALDARLALLLQLAELRAENLSLREQLAAKDAELEALRQQLSSIGADGAAHGGPDRGCGPLRRSVRMGLDARRCRLQGSCSSGAAPLHKTQSCP